MMGFSAKLSDVSLLRESMSAIAEIIDETEMLVGHDGIRMVAADRAVVAVVDFSLSRNAFDEYDYQGDVRFGINLINFLRVLRRAMPNDILRMALAENRLEMKLIGDSTRTFRLPIIDVSKQELPPLDKLEFSASFEINSEILSSGIEDADLITDSLIFLVHPERLLLKADSDSAGTELELVPGQPGLANLRADSVTRARYSLDYLKRMVKAKKLSENAKIALASEYPMRMAFDVPNRAQLVFILAPRREE
jgi:proliferating cell nuclear antigen PCNA